MGLSSQGSLGHCIAELGPAQGQALQRSEETNNKQNHAGLSFRESTSADYEDGLEIRKLSGSLRRGAGERQPFRAFQKAKQLNPVAEIRDQRGRNWLTRKLRVTE